MSCIIGFVKILDFKICFLVNLVKWIEIVSDIFYYFYHMRLLGNMCLWVHKFTLFCFCSMLKTEEEILKIDIKPGWKKGTKITFPGKGNQEAEASAPDDLIFVVDEKPHALFKRDGNDLVITQKILLVEALVGNTLNITTLDGRELTIQVTDVVKPKFVLVVPNEGMPISKELGKKGNLRIKFDVMFPSRLTTQQKYELKRILSNIDDWFSLLCIVAFSQLTTWGEGSVYSVNIQNTTLVLGMKSVHNTNKPSFLPCLQWV